MKSDYEWSSLKQENSKKQLLDEMFIKVLAISFFSFEASTRDQMV